MHYNNIISNYPKNMYNPSQVGCCHNTLPPGRGPVATGGNRPFGGGFLLPFALGFVSSPLIFGATNPRPPYYGPYYGPNYPYYPYY